MISNIDAKQLHKTCKGNGGNSAEAHHKALMNGKKTQIQTSGCYKNPQGNCETCPLPVDECAGNFTKPKGGKNFRR